MSSNWTGGYAATGATYTSAAYDEISPNMLRYAMLSAGRLPPAHDGGSFNYCELGFGYGLSLNINAASMPEGQFWGTDFMSEQVAVAKQMHSSKNIHVFDQGFDEFCNRPDLPQFDFIALHGIYSWVSPDVQKVLLKFFEEKLAPGGVVYISYNAQPGWHLKQAVHRTLKMHHDFIGHMLPTVEGANQALAFAEQTFAIATPFFNQLPAMREGVEHLKTLPRKYLAHEYFNQASRMYYFDEAAAEFSTARLQYATSASLLSNIDGLNLVPAAREQLAKIPNTVMRETLRDIHMATGFRKDIWTRGAPQLDPIEHVRQFSKVQFQLMLPASSAPRKVKGALGESTITETLLVEVLEFIEKNGGTATAEQLFVLPEMAKIGFIPAKEMLDILVGSNALRPRFNNVKKEATEACKQLNAKLLRKASTTEDWSFLVSPLGACGVLTGRVAQMFVEATLSGQKTTDGLAKYAVERLVAMGHGVLQDGKPVSDLEQMRQIVRNDAQAFLDAQLPLLRKLGAA